MSTLPNLAIILQSSGHEVPGRATASKRWKQRPFVPEFAFLDIGLPRLNGYELARRMRDAPATARCVLIAVTGWGQDGDKRRAREAGFDRHMVKPVEPDQILGWSKFSRNR
ncbi:MAG: response regulator [Betaproteobacteria bacterium]|nr:response regulator [Betaproteobacteria bacterium]